MLKTNIYRTFLSLLYCLITVSPSSGSLLVWNSNTEADLAGYIVYYGTSPGDYTEALDVGNLTAYDFADLPEGKTYYIALTAYDRSGNESDFSSELSFFTDDGVPFSQDNCPGTFNADQKDSYPPGGNGVGDACECEGDFDGDGDVDGDDCRTLLETFNRNFWYHPCTNDDPCTADFNCSGSIDAIDVLLFLEDFGRGPLNYPCPAHDLENWCSY